MNESDSIMMRSLMASLKRLEWRGTVVIDVSQTHLMRMQLILLKGLLEERGMRGLFLSVDRPHQYLEHLARMQNINIGGMAFADIICRYSADTKQGSKVELLAGPFNINNTSSAFHAWAHSVGDALLDPNKGGFALVDNPAALLPYNSPARVEFFLGSIHEAFEKDMIVLVPLLIDKERNHALYESIRQYCIGEISKMEYEVAPDSSSNLPERANVNHDEPGVNHGV